MDILAARKKAAERAQAKKKQQREPPIDAQPAHIEEPRRPEAPVADVPPPEQAASAGDEHGDKSARSGDDGPPVVQPQEIELLSFRLGGEEYAVMVAEVREVLKLFYLTSVPNAPDYILGIMSLRGTMLPVIDLCKRLHLTPGVRDEKSRIIVVSSRDEEVGLMVDRVMGVFRIASEEVKPTPENIEKGAEFLRGIVRKEDRLYILLDLEKAVGL